MTKDFYYGDKMIFAAPPNSGLHAYMREAVKRLGRVKLGGRFITTYAALYIGIDTAVEEGELAAGEAKVARRILESLSTEITKKRHAKGETAGRARGVSQGRGSLAWARRQMRQRNKL